MLIVFLIPHSLLGSEFDYSQLEKNENLMAQNIEAQISVDPGLFTSQGYIEPDETQVWLRLPVIARGGATQ
jgi:hypothetical protein